MTAKAQESAVYTLVPINLHLTAYPCSDSRRSEATHVLQTRASHGEIADEVPDQGGELEDGGDEGEEEVL